MLKENKGFTLVEVLAVVAIISILTTVVFGAINIYIKKGKDEYNKKMEDEAVLVSKDYFVDSPNQLKEGYVTFKELAAKGYLSKDFLDAYGNSCMDKSYVKVEKIEDKTFTPIDAKYYACIICDNDGYKTENSENCDLKKEEPNPTPDDPTPDNPPIVPDPHEVTIIVKNGTIEGASQKTYEIVNGQNLTSGTLSGTTGYKGPYIGKCDFSGGNINNNNQLKISNINKDGKCHVYYSPPGTTNVKLVIDGSTGVSVPVSTATITENTTYTFDISVPSPSDRYISSGNVTCDNSGIAKTDFDYNWSNVVNNSTRKDRLTLKNNGVSGESVTCHLGYSARWVGISKKTYTVGETVSYGGLTWTVVSDKGNSTRLALNSVASGSANKSYANAGTWLTNDWLEIGTKTTLKKDKSNLGLLPLSTGVYINSASGISTNLTDYNYYVGSSNGNSRFYNAATRNHKTLTKKALVTGSYVKGNSDTSMPKSIYNVGYSSSSISIGIKTLSTANKDLYYINSSGELVFPDSGTPTTSTLPNSHYSDRYMSFGLYPSVSNSTTQGVGTCSSDSDTLCTIRWKNYWKAAITSSGTSVYEATDLGPGYQHFDGNVLFNDTKVFSFDLCGGSNHGKNLKLSARSSGGYTWVSPAGTTNKPSFPDPPARFKIASIDITNCPKSGKLSEYVQCTPTKVGEPHTRKYYTDESSTCKAYKKYTLTDTVKNIYYRPYLEVRER